MPRKAIIIGAGPAGLTAAYELLKRTDIIPIVLEKDGEIGGISRTIDYKGNRMDMGPHRFFSKSDRVMDWWLNILPLTPAIDNRAVISYQNKHRKIGGHGEKNTAENKGSMLVIPRLTRIYFLRKFFAYPIQLSLDTLRTLGVVRTIRIILSFLWIKVFPRKPETSLEDFIINKFGKQLYLLFFKDYTEKVWGIPPDKISAEWGAQRIKGVSLGKAINQAIRSLRKKKAADIGQKDTETSLIEQFLYPQYGPGSLWEEVARQIEEMGGRIYKHQAVKKIELAGGKIASITATNTQTGESGNWEGEFYFSTMPVQELIAGMGNCVPADVQEIAAGLEYRDFINVGILLKQLSTPEGSPIELKDNWIYIQERDVKVGRLMIYNNWGGGMIKDPNTTWIGMEYFCDKKDAFWANDEKTIQAIAIAELEKIGLARPDDVLDCTVRRMEKTYPAYFGTYNRFDSIRNYTDRFQNLFLIGRNGMHKYNNADHSMLCAMVAVDNIRSGVKDKANLWAINTEQEYHEEKQQQQSPEKAVSGKKISRPVFSGFRSYLLENRTNRILLWVSAILIVSQLVIFKFLYPFASFIYGDSYVYLNAAMLDTTINLFPIGYSRFLRLFSVFTKSDTALVAFQYLFVQASALWLMFTLFFFYSPRRITRLLIALFIVLNPVTLYICNYVSSDALFMALSIIWFTLLVWTIKQPGRFLIISQVIVLSIAFTIRYNALYYPLITLAVYLMTRQRPGYKLLGIAGSFLFILLFTAYTAHQYKVLTGVRQFSPFSGWQLSNNALYAYRYVDSANREPVPPSLKVLDQTVRNYFDSSRDINNHPVEMTIANTVYMWDSRSPLRIYEKKSSIKDTSYFGNLRNWASIAPLYSEYGKYLMLHYPGAFIQHYIIPNAIKYYAPPVEFLSQYNTGLDSVADVAQVWFGYRSKKVQAKYKGLQTDVIGVYPVVSGILSGLFLVGFMCCWLLNMVNFSTLKGKVLGFAFCFWLVTFVFSVFVAPITLRYQLFTICLSGSFALLEIEMIYTAAFAPGMSMYNQNKTCAQVPAVS